MLVTTRPHSLVRFPASFPSRGGSSRADGRRQSVGKEKKSLNIVCNPDENRVSNLSVLKHFGILAEADCVQNGHHTDVVIQMGIVAAENGRF